MIKYDKETLEQAVKNSHDWTELCLKLGKKRSTHTARAIRKNIEEHKIDISHFDRYFKTKQRRIHPIVKKTCPICREFFEVASGGRREKTYCSSKCSNALSLGNRRSPETNLKVSLSLRGRPPPNKGKKLISKKYVGSCVQLDFLNRLFLTKENTRRENNGKIQTFYNKKCEFCGKSFATPFLKIRFCSSTCSGKEKWTRPGYRKNLTNQLHNRVKNGQHQGWKTRNKLSYAEQFFKDVIDKNLPNIIYSMNHSVHQKQLDIESSACYFLDFYFPILNLDLEIDGSQHNLPERKAHDIKRDEALITHGYDVYRIKWKNINTQSGKDYIQEEIKKFLEYIKNKSVLN